MEPISNFHIFTINNLNVNHWNVFPVQYKLDYTFSPFKNTNQHLQTQQKLIQSFVIFNDLKEPAHATNQKPPAPRDQNAPQPSPNTPQEFLAPPNHSIE